MKQTYGIHWFRRDLRLSHNPALLKNYEKHQGRVVGVFCFDKKFLARPDFSHNRFQFFLNTLNSLREEMRLTGGDLLFLDVGPEEAFSDLFSSFHDSQIHLPETISWNRDYEPYSRDRDARMEAWFQKQNVSCMTQRDHLVIEPHELFKADNPEDGYQVYTPFLKKWTSLFLNEDRSQFKKKNISKLQFLLSWKDLKQKQNNLLEHYKNKNSDLVTVSLPPAGSEGVQKSMKRFESSIAQYAQKRDFPFVAGTSGFSIYLKNGSLTTTEIIQKFQLTGGKFLNELVWREFYYHILWRHPRVEKTAFQERFEKIRWENRADFFEAWKSGQTGYPIVDAGMRQLKKHGWMHNRVRMIVASFLTKDLLVDWRWGERYFMEQLLDGDLAPNNGGWQWAASTGCDPQPYFRIFNPKLQSQKFDPEGAYIKKYVPELSHLDSREIHEPPAFKRGGYPAPIVDHREQREKALHLYKACL